MRRSTVGVLQRHTGPLLLLVLICGCSHKSQRPMAPGGGGGRHAVYAVQETAADADGPVDEAEREEAAPAMEPPPAPAPAVAGALASAPAGGPRAAYRRRRAAKRPAPPPPPQPGQQPRVAPQQAPPPAQARKVHYQGYVKLTATKPQDLLDKAVALTEQIGGYVEQLAGNRLTVRVPVERFRALLAQILELGDVLQHWITAEDITDAFQSVQLRLRVLKASRKRLVELLAKATQEQEKLSLLGEIKRLTEQIDQLESRLQALESLASFSRITIEAVPRPQKAAYLAGQDLGVFRWIGQLSPFDGNVAEEGERLELPVPEGMVEMDHDAPLFGSIPWVARSAEGVVVRSSERVNDPRADAAFWLDAVKQRLGLQYPDPKTYDLGAFSAVELRNEGKPDYRYVVALRVVGETLQVVEVYYPSTKLQAQYGEAVKRALQRASRDN